MYSTINVPLPARRSAAAAGAAVALAAGAAVLAPGAQAVPAAPATASGGGTSTATVLRAGLDVSLLGKTVDVPVHASLNDVKAPADAKETALTVKVGSGVERGREVNLLRADVATAQATTDRWSARGYANVVKAEVHVPGLPLLALVKVDALTSTATCRVGAWPTATSTLAGVTVLGRHLAVSAVGTTDVRVPGVGEVRLDLTRTATTSRTAAATALKLNVRVNPLNLGVAAVTGEVTLAQATCRTPQAGGSTGGATSGGSSGGSSGGASGGSSGGSTGGSTNGGSTSGGSASGGSTSGGPTSGGSSSGGSSSGGSTGGSANGGSTSGGSAGTSGTSGGSGTSGSGGTGGGGAHAQTGATAGNLAETGASSSTPYLAGGAAVLVAAGGGAFLLTNRRRRAAAPADSER
ncbi:SCO1860 family LAETG-anchored protein [Streptomyces sp. NPDC051976]|uniref:SCO1860 family LAETG-anchored protein n=1 Tax=Streptomyces sp. NPDC051976 TaxID=3154947 RepID=UPI00341DD971